MTPLSGEDTLGAFLEFMNRNDLDDARLYEGLCAINTHRLGVLLERLKGVEAMKSPKRGPAGGSWAANRNRVKGRLYEAIIGLIVKGTGCFETWHNVRTTTNEIDLLLKLGQRSSWIPQLRSWGSHCVAECKNHKTHVKVDWVDKLAALLPTHGAHVGLLFSRKGVRHKESAGGVRHKLQLLAVAGSGTFILCFDWDDLERCAAGENFLRLLTDRFVEVRAGIRKLNLLAG